jgi:hypothetical protein
LANSPRFILILENALASGSLVDHDPRPVREISVAMPSDTNVHVDILASEMKTQARTAGD